ncbi:MAG: hypothetical protein AAFP99_07675 [Pseudomonadota bacterium]
MPIQKIAETVIRALERAAVLYEQDVNAANGFGPKMVDEGVRLSQALGRLRDLRDAERAVKQADAEEFTETQKRELLTALEAEIETIAAARVAARMADIPTACPRCGADVAGVETAQATAAAEDA